MEAARKEYQEGVKIYRKLAEKNPENYLPSIAQTLNNLGIVDSAQNGQRRRGRLFEEALMTTLLP